MRVIRAEHMGWCFGVRDAVKLVTEHARWGPVTVLGDLVHNESVNAALRARGVQLTRELDHVANATVIITAHGASETMLAQARQAVPIVVEATCPLVHFAHRSLKELTTAGYHPVIIGQRDHVEVRGMTGDLPAFDVVLSPDEVRQLSPRDRFGVVAQTTQPLDRVQSLVALLRECFPLSEVRFTDTVCLPTKQRQNAAIELARQCDVVVVIGGRHSNNTNELAQTCARHCRRIVRIETASDLRAEWFADTDTVGITAGTSTPDPIINVVEQWLADLPGRIHEQTHVDSTYS
jgi:4-hydroxy-3-methylbut-2-enyl diphosphate reductase